MSGSTWSKWDFHLHSPYSVLNNQFGDPNNDETWEKYIIEIENASQKHGIEAIGITDYFTIDGYKKIQEFQSQGRLQNLFLFPNIEFRIDKVIYRDKSSNANPLPSDGKRLNFHVLFSPEVPTRKLEENFLHDLDFVYESDPFTEAHTKKLKPLNLVEYGKKLQNDQSTFQNFPALHVGCMNARVDINQVDKLLKNQFKGQYLLVLAEENLSLMNWNGQDHGLRKQLIQMSHAIFSSNQGTRDFLLGKKHPNLQEYLDEFGHLKPCIWGCDSHDYETRFLKPDEERFCWIKGDVTWEGLKQILFEPNERVAIQKHKPEHRKSSYSIKSVGISETQARANLKIQASNLRLNQNLITIIGGRGSGKTALLDLIASCFREGQKLSAMEHSFFHRLYRNTKSNKNEASNPIETTLTFQSDQTITTSVGSKNSEIFEHSDILYLTQNHFDEYAANPNTLNQYILKLVFEQNTEEERTYQKHEEQIKGIFNEIQQHNLDIHQLKDHIQSKEQDATNLLKEQKGEEKDYKERINQIEQEQNSKNDVIEQLTEQVKVLTEQKRLIDELLGKLEHLSNQFSALNTLYGKEVLSINQLLQKVFKDKVNKYTLSESLTIPNYIKQFEGLNKSLTSLKEHHSNEIDEKERSLNSFKGIDKEIADLRKKYNSVLVNIEETQKILSTIKEKKQQIERLENKRYEQYITAINETVKLNMFLAEVIQSFESGKNRLLENIRFEAHVHINSEQFIDALTDKMHGGRIRRSELEEGFFPLFTNLLEQINHPHSESFLDELQEFKKAFRGKSEKIYDLRKPSTSLSDYYDVILNNIFQIGINIYFNSFGEEKAIGVLSMGERAVILLKILLSLDDKPLLIDQPEEHLDNRYIYEELKPAFREAKKSRQIIIATHNANLVVNTDAEQIIIAQSKNGELSYKSGTLENVEIRDSIKKILEGGHEAFKKREEKYGYIF